MKKIILFLLFITPLGFAQTTNLGGDYFSKPFFLRSTATRIGMLSATDSLLNMKLITPSLGVASGTSLALGGATISIYKLAVNGSVFFKAALNDYAWMMKKSDDNEGVAIYNDNSNNMDFRLWNGAGTLTTYINSNGASYFSYAVNNYLRNNPGANDSYISTYWSADSTWHNTQTITGGATKRPYSFDGFSSYSFDNAITLSSGAFTGNILTRGTDAFTTTATADTVAITGASVNDIYVVSYVTAVTAAEAPLSVVSTATGFIVTRPSGVTSGATYAYIRQK